MTYFTDPRSKWRVELVYEKLQCNWEGRKFFAEEILHTASGSELRQFMIQLTMRGIEEDEPAQALLSLDDTASAGIYIFAPNRMDSL